MNIVSFLEMNEDKFIVCGNYINIISSQTNFIII